MTAAGEPKDEDYSSLRPKNNKESNVIKRAKVNTNNVNFALFIVIFFSLATMVLDFSLPRSVKSAPLESGVGVTVTKGQGHVPLEL